MFNLFNINARCCFVFSCDSHFTGRMGRHDEESEDTYHHKCVPVNSTTEVASSAALFRSNAVKPPDLQHATTVAAILINGFFMRKQYCFN